MEQLLVVAMPGAWPSGWNLDPLQVRSVVVLSGPDGLACVDCVAIVPESKAQVAAAVRTIKACRTDPLAMVLACHNHLAGLDEVLWRYEFDGFIDLGWPVDLARAALRMAIRQVQLGRNVVEIQRLVLEHSMGQTKSLQHQANHDDLTGLANRRYFVEAAEREHERAQRSGRPYALVYVDVDNLKQLNTRYGHAGGSDALREVAKVLGSLVRSADVAARVGGDEFVVLLAECERTGAVAFAERLLRRLRLHPVTVAGKPLTLTVSVGVAAFPFDGDAYPEVLERADRALLNAKSTGKDKVAVLAAI